jgi:Holliday junction DNA helicase RuvB
MHDTNQETIIEKSLRPLCLNEFIGQDRMKDNLKVFIKAAKERNSSLDHVLLSGPAGLGKTSMAQIIAKEMGVNFRSTSGPLLTKAADVASILTNLQEGDVFFIDEIHRLNISVEEILYPAMEDYKLDLIIGEGPAARSVTINIARFTLIGATTRSGLISKPLRERFGIPLKLHFYNLDDLKIILRSSVKKIDTELDDEGSAEIAKRSRGTPRIALRLLKRVADFAQCENKKSIDKAIASAALEKLEVDQYGLDSNDYKYLKFIAEKYKGGPVGIETIAAALSEHKDSLEETIEPYLIQQGFIHRTPRGRMLTDFAFNYLGSKKLVDSDLFSFGSNKN